jgi:hypothetical protein
METNSILEILAENKWQLLQDEENGGYSRDVLVRFLPGVPRNGFPAIVALLKARTSAKNTEASTTVTNPSTTPEGPWTGTYTGGRIWYKLSQDGAPGKNMEGTYTLYQALHKGGLSEANIITDHGCRYRVTQTWYFDYPSLVTVPTSSSGVSYSRTTPVRDDEYGVWTYAIEMRERLYQNVTEYTSERDQFEYRQRTEHQGVRQGDLTDSGAAVSLPNLDTQLAGTIVDLQRTKNEDCTQNIEVVKRNSIIITGADTSKQITLSETQEMVLDKNEVAAEALPTEQVAGIIKAVKVHKNDFARFDNEVTTRTAAAVADASVQKTVDLFTTTEEDLDRNLTSPGTPPGEQTPGIIATVQTDKNEFSLYDVRTKTATAAAVSDAVLAQTISKFETLDEDLDRNQAAAVAPPASQTAGSIVTRQNSKNEFALFDVKTQTRTAAAVSNAEQEKVINVFETQSRVQNRNQVNAESLPVSQTAGSIVEVVDRLNEFDRHDATITTRTAAIVSNAEQEKTITGDETVARVLNRNQVSGGTLPTSLTAGTIVEMLNRLNEFNRYDVNTTTRTATYQHLEYSWADRLGTAEVYWGRNATSVQYEAMLSTANLTAATNNNISKMENRFGLIDYVITKQPYGTGTPGIGESSQSGTSTAIQYGYIYDGTEKRNVRKKRTVSTAWTLSWFTTYSAAFNDAGDGCQGSRIITSGGLFGSIKTSIPTATTWDNDE